MINNQQKINWQTKYTYITMEIGEWIKHVESMKVHHTSSTDIKTADESMLRNQQLYALR